MEENTKEIVKACLENKDLLDIVRTIASMKEEEKEIFKKKVNKYFFSKNSSEDVMAYKFYQFILVDENAKKVLDEVMKIGK